jgi:hypothetical protein
MKYKYIILFLIIFILYFLFYKNESFIDKQSFNKIYILHAEEVFKGSLTFMFKPVVDSITKLLNDTYPSVPIIHKINDYDFLNKLNENDVLIWMGHRGEENVNYNDLRNRNVYTISYNTEPFPTIVNSNEIWTYSKYLFNIYEKNGNQTIKFLPIVCDDSTDFISYKNINPKDLKLYFLGIFHFRQEKYDTIMQNNFMKDKLIELDNIWNEEDYINLITEKNRPKIFLNITKTNSVVLPSVRINKLLSNKCIVISEHTNPIDEELYNGIVYFTDIDKIADLFIELTNKTSGELEMESETRYQKFKEIFNYKNAENLISVK